MIHYLWIKRKMAEQITHHPDEQEPVPKDISQEFLTLEIPNWHRFLRSLRNEPALNVTINYSGLETAQRLKAFIEDTAAADRGQKRIATVRATETQHNEAANVFYSGVKWEKVEQR